MNDMVVEMYKDHNIHMRGLNHFSCPALSLFGYSSAASLKAAITRAINKKARQIFFRG